MRLQQALVAVVKRDELPWLKCPGSTHSATRIDARQDEVQSTIRGVRPAVGGNGIDAEQVVVGSVCPNLFDLAVDRDTECRA